MLRASRRYIDESEEDVVFFHDLVKSNTKIRPILAKRTYKEILYRRHSIIKHVSIIKLTKIKEQYFKASLDMMDSPYETEYEFIKRCNDMRTNFDIVDSMYNSYKRVLENEK